MRQKPLQAASMGKTVHPFASIFLPTAAARGFKWSTLVDVWRLASSNGTWRR